MYSMVSTFLQRFWSKTILPLIAELLNQLNQLSLGISNLSWLQTYLDFLKWFGLLLYIVGIILAAAECAIEYSHGHGSPSNLLLNCGRGFFAWAGFAVIPVPLYAFCMTLQGGFMKDLAGAFAIFDKYQSAMQVVSKLSLSSAGVIVMEFGVVYAVVKTFLGQIKRGGILLILVAIGSLYMISVPRGYTDGFSGWCKQVIALCITAFLQTIILYCGLMAMIEGMTILGIGIALAAAETPRIADRFGLDTSTRASVGSAVHTGTMAISAVRSIRSIAAGAGG